jgi:hypothetical protein
MPTKRTSQRRGKCPSASENAVATLPVTRAATRLALPGTAPDSWISEGMPASRAPAMSGMLA